MTRLARSQRRPAELASRRAISLRRCRPLTQIARSRCSLQNGGGNLAPITMTLTTRNLPNYLLSRGLISYESVVDGDLMITDASHRNRAFRVLRGAQPGYFVKQIRQWDPVSIAGWQQEDACYRRFSSSTFLPKHHKSDVESRILVLELVSGSETLSEYHRRAPCFVAAGRRERGALSALHRAPHGAGEARKSPWILPVQETKPRWCASLKAANAGLL